VPSSRHTEEWRDRDMLVPCAASRAPRTVWRSASTREIPYSHPVASVQQRGAELAAGV